MRRVRYWMIHLRMERHWLMVKSRHLRKLMGNETPKDLHWLMLMN